MKETLRHWILQRITAVALIPLGVWFVVTFMFLVTAPYEEALLWMASPVSATCTVLFLGVLFYHGVLGMQVVFEDYIPQESLRHRVITFTNYASAAMAIVGMGSLLKVVIDHV